MRPIVLATDYGLDGPYVGQLKSVIYQLAPNAKVIDIIHNLPACNPEASAYLLASFIGNIPHNSIIVGVVDPGVGSDREPIIIEGDGYTFVGPNNGLFAIAARKLNSIGISKIVINEEPFSNTFHGRDIFAPYAAKLAMDLNLSHEVMCVDSLIGAKWPDNLLEIIYIDKFGNAISGLSFDGKEIDKSMKCLINNYELKHNDSFFRAEDKECFWYCNSNNLLEIAANKKSAENLLKISIGSKLNLIFPR